MMNQNQNSRERILVYRSGRDLDIEGMMNGKTPEEIVVQFQQWAEDLNNDNQKREISGQYFIEVEWAGHDGGHEVTEKFYTLENDKEYQGRMKKLDLQKKQERERKESARIKKEEKAQKLIQEKAISEQARRAMYETLKKEFGE